MLLRARTFAALTAFLFIASLAFAQLKYSVTSYPTNGSVIDVVAGDFNRDGWADLQVLSAGNGMTAAVSFFRGTGNGAFVRQDLSLAPRLFLETADLNGDGSLDLLTLAENVFHYKTYLNYGNGTFRRGVDVSSPTFGATLDRAALGDVNGDGKVDIVAIQCDSSFNCSAVILLNNGDATFRANGVLPAGEFSGSVAVTDFNRDGRLDIAVSAMGPSRAVVYFGRGDGTFGSKTEAVMDVQETPGENGEVPPFLTVADFNGDAVDDIALAGGVSCGSACGTSVIEIHLSSVAGTFARASHFDGAGDGGSALLAGDYNNDFKQDLVSYNTGHFGGGLFFYLGRGDGTFVRTTSTFGLDDISGFWTHDLDRNSRHDLMGASWRESFLNVALNTNNTFNCPPPPSDALRAKICSPGSTVGTSFQVRASGNSPAGVKRLELWVDGTKRYETLNDQLRFNLTLGPGTHRLVVVAIDRYKGSAQTARTLTVQ